MYSDDEIVRAVLKGRVEEFTILVERYQSAAFGLAYRILGRREDAEDAVQDTFVRTYRGLGSYTGQAGFWPWVRRITMNCCISRLRRELPSDRVEAVLDSDDTCADPVEADVLRKCKSEAVRAIIADLPALYRTAVVLRYQENLCFDEIGELLHERAGTIRVRLHRAHKILAARLAEIRDEL